MMKVSLRCCSCCPAREAVSLPEAQAAKTESVEDQVKIGAVDYQNFCAACHGKDARGNGPVAMELKTAPAISSQVGGAPKRRFRCE